MNNELNLWITTLLRECSRRQINPKQEFESSLEMNAQGRRQVNYLKFGQLIIERLGWSGIYPSTPDNPEIKEALIQAQRVRAN